MENSILTVKHFNAFFGETKVLKDINLEIPKNEIIALMGPSGCGKTTFLRCINRLHELTSGAKSEGNMYFHDEDIYLMNLIMLRRKIGMVFQRPNPFPTMSIFENVIAGYSLNDIKLTKAQKEEIVEDSLIKAALWNEVRDTLHKKGTFLSGGQQQRLCIARSLSMKPDILLLDEPTSSLDPISSNKIEELLLELKKDYTIIIVTHNTQQAGRISDKAAFFYLGELIEYDTTTDIFTNPQNKTTQNYITGRFG
ncbi:MAG: phosphate ABC transporter ATP-binding protein [Bacteroidetes bacterium]|nr:phosphate ABC transporter ATP-binding protein [Bacteroidota bacterium]